MAKLLYYVHDLVNKYSRNVVPGQTLIKSKRLQFNNLKIQYRVRAQDEVFVVFSFYNNNNNN